MKKTSDMCATFISPELVRHLWYIVDSCEGDSFVFVLSSRRLGDGKVQDIKVVSGGVVSQHTVLGCKPVDFTIKVSGNGNDMIMSLVPSEKTANEISKWNSFRSIFPFYKTVIAAFSRSQVCSVCKTV